MAIPTAVKAAADRSTQLIDQLNNPESSASEGETDNTSPAAEQENKGDQGKPATPEPDATRTPEPAEDFKTKYLSLQGKYNAEIPKLHETARTLQQELEQVKTENAQLKEAASNNNKQDQQQSTGDFDPEALSEYGPEFKDMASRMNQLISENQQLKQQIGSVEQNIGSVQQEQSKKAYNQYLEQVKQQVEQAGKDFAQVNADPSFLTWLKEPHPFTGQPRHFSLKDAEKKLDVNRTLQIFREYLDSTPSKPQQQPQQPNLQPNNRSNSDTQPPGTNQGKVWTRADIKKLYDEKMAGKWNGKLADFKALEADIFRAQNEGRVQ